MSLARLKRIAALEARKPTGGPRVDPSAAALRWVLDCHAAVAGGKPSPIPRFGPPREPSPAMAAALKHLDHVAARLAVGTP
jgi:hypothetical protein